MFLRQLCCRLPRSRDSQAREGFTISLFLTLREPLQRHSVFWKIGRQEQIIGAVRGIVLAPSDELTPACRSPSGAPLLACRQYVVQARGFGGIALEVRIAQ